MVPELEVLGHIINSVGTTPIPQHVQVITDYPPPPGHETAATLPGHGQLLPPFHTRYRKGPGAPHHRTQRW
jgi:hypothetical protein